MKNIRGKAPRSIPITNYKGYENRDCVYADLLVCSGELIGCDVYSTSVSNGFMQPLLGN